MENFIHAFELLKSEGFIKHYGISTENINVLKRSYDLSNGNCEAVECDYSLLNRMVESDFLPFCNKHKIQYLQEVHCQEDYYQENMIVILFSQNQVELIGIKVEHLGKDMNNVLMLLIKLNVACPNL